MNKIYAKIFSALILSSFYIQGYGQGIVINEFMSSNESLIKDSYGEYSNWIELYNASDEVINLLNYGLSDDINDFKKFVLPNISIKPYAYLLIYASGNNINDAKELHTNFKISQSGEPIILTNNQGVVLSLIEPLFIPSDKSYACITDGNDILDIAEIPTPGFSNNTFAKVYCSHSSGFYIDSFELNLKATKAKQKIYYTLNGERPTINSILYTTPIVIRNDEHTPLNISLIPTTPLSGPSQLYDFIWKKPKSVYRCHTIRFAAFQDDIMQTEAYTKNYFVDNNIKTRYNFPVVALVTDSLNLFDYDTGIYVPGKRFDENGFNWWPEGNYHNRGDEWEREIHITYFEKNGSLGFETNIGMRMRGYGSASNPQKSFTAYFRKEYGMSNIEYPVFNNSIAKKYKRLIFRNSGNDFIYSHFKDAMLQEVISSMNLELQEFQPSVVFLNGEYWGIHNIREKYDKYYFKYKYGIDESEINILGICGGIEEGDNNSYMELVNFIEQSDLSINENYEYVSNNIDIHNFIDFQIAEIYFANYDWPCNNFKIWKDNSSGSKWRFLIYDLDFSFGYDKNSSYATKSMEHATSNDNSWPHCECSNLIFRKLLSNEEFKNQFLDRFSYSLKNTFEANRVKGIIDDFKLMYSTEIGEHIKRWNYPSGIEQWELEINKLIEFAEERPCRMSENIISYFNLTSYDFECIRENLPDTELLILFPNPNNGTFALFNNYSKDIEDGRVSILNYYGQVVFSEDNISMKLGERHHFKLDYLQKGMYILLFKSDGISDEWKLIIR